MAEQVSYYWEIENFSGSGSHLKERLVLIEWIPGPPGMYIEEEAIAATTVRVERIADSRTVQFFQVYLHNRSLPRITFEEVIEDNGEVVRRNKWIVSDATIPKMDQRDRKDGEHDWATKPYIDEFVLQL